MSMEPERSRSEPSDSMRNFGLPKPVKEGDEIDVTIEAVGSKGDGIGKIEGFVVFVPGVQAGETIKVKIKEVRGRSAIGEKIA